jgi:L-lysine exporter family protein LysE/ArgO
MLLALLRGVALGFVGGIPVGPVNAAVIDTALRKCVKRAIAIGMGGAFVDMIYSQLAVLGLGTLLNGVPGLSTLFLGVGGVVLVVLGARALSRPPLTDEPVAPVVARRALVSSFFTGVLITVLNPAVLVSWVLLAGTILADLTPLQALVAGLGIFIGTSLWFTMIAWLASRGRVRLGQRAAWITRTVGATLVVYGVFLVGKASATVFALAHP